MVVEYDAAAVTPEPARRCASCGYRCSGECVPRASCAVAEEADGAVETVGAASGHGDASMAAMARALRDRFIVAAAPPCRSCSGAHGHGAPRPRAPGPLGMSSEVFQLLLSLRVVLYSSSVFLSGAQHCATARST